MPSGDITAIDHLNGNSILEGIDCDSKFKSTPSVIRECQSLKACPAPSSNLDQSVKNTMSVMPQIKKIDEEIKRLQARIVPNRKIYINPEERKSLKDKIKLSKSTKLVLQPVPMDGRRNFSR